MSRLWLPVVLVLWATAGAAQDDRSATRGDVEATAQTAVTTAAPYGGHGEQGAAAPPGTGRYQVSVRVYGGWRGLWGGDVNEGVADTMQWHVTRLVGAGVTVREVMQEVGGGVPALQRGTEVGADVIVNLTPRVGLVGGVGRIESASEGMILAPELSLWWPSRQSMTLQLQAVPVRFGAQYTYPLGSRVRLQVEGGTTLYVTRFRWLDRFDRFDSYGAPSWTEVLSDTSGHDFGLHGGVWLDVDLSERFGLLVGVQGTHANIAPLEGEVRYEQDCCQRPPREGTLRLFGFDRPSQHRQMAVGDRRIFGISPDTVSEAKLGLSGLRISSGLRIRF